MSPHLKPIASTGDRPAGEVLVVRQQRKQGKARATGNSSQRMYRGTVQGAVIEQAGNASHSETNPTKGEGTLRGGREGGRVPGTPTSVHARQRAHFGCRTFLDCRRLEEARCNPCQGEVGRSNAIRLSTNTTPLLQRWRVKAFLPQHILQ